LRALVFHFAQCSGNPSKSGMPLVAILRVRGRSVCRDIASLRPFAMALASVLPMGRSDQVIEDVVGKNLKSEYQNVPR